MDFRAAYFALANLWIVMSGNLLDLLPGIEDIRGDLEVYKGLLFVLVTSVIFYLLLRSWQKAYPSVTINDRAGTSTSASVGRWAFLIFIGMLFIIVTVGYLVFERMKQIESRKNEHYLAAVAKLQSDDIQEKIQQHFKNAYMESTSALLVGSVETWSERDTFSERELGVLRRHMERLQQTYHYGSIVVLDDHGRSLVQFGAGISISAQNIAALYQRALVAGKPVIGRMYGKNDSDSGRYLHLPMVVPLRSTQDENKVIGGLLFDINPENLLFSVVMDWPMPSKTAETLLVSRDGDDVVFLSDWRHQKGGLLSKMNIETNSQLLASQVMKGRVGIVRGVDYRGKPVIGYAVEIPDTGWRMISKIDVSEIEQPIQTIAIRVTLSIVLTVFACGFLLLFWWRQKRLEYEAAQLHAELQQQALLKHFDYLSKYANDIILLMDDDGVIVEANDRAEVAYGRSRQELVGLHVFDLRRPSEIVDFADQWRELKAEKSLLFETCHLHRDGSEFPVEISSRRIETESGAYTQHIIRDITERKNAEAREQRLMNIRIALSETNGAILRLEDEATLFPVVSRIAVEFGGMVLAWVGVPDATGEYIVPAAQDGEGIGVLENLTIKTAADAPEGRGAVGTAFREKRAVILNDFGASEMTASWHEIAKKYRLMAVATFPIMRGGKSYAVLSVYSAQIGAFDDEIVGLLSELAANVSFALDNLDRESRRSQAERALRLSESRLRLVADEAPLPMIVYAEDWEVLQVNRAWTEITGYGLDDIPTVDAWTEKAYGEGAAVVLAAIRRLFEAQKRQDGGERVIRCKDGSSRIWHFISSPLGRLADGRQYVISMAVDVTKSRAAERELRFAAKVFEGNHDNIMLTDAEGRIVSVNPAFSAVTGYSAEEVIGKNPRLLNSGVHDAAFFRQFWNTILSTGYWQGEIWNKRKNGEDYLAWLSVTAVRDDKGNITNYIGIADDITESRKNKSQAEFLAYFDSLTRLPNRQLGRDRLEQALVHAERAKSRVALIYLDLDNFRVINDTLGHLVGDRLLNEFAGRLSASVRETDTISRQGGDEFLIMLTHISHSDVVKNIATDVLEMASKPFHIEQHDLSISTSIGIAIYPDDGKDAGTLLKNADLAMYNAKQSGRNTFRFFSEDMNTLVEEHLRIRNDLTRALDQGEFVLHYQPQIDLSSGKVSGAEALLRWEHPDLGMLFPDRFIQIAEDCGMIISLGSWALREACRQVAEWQRSGLTEFVVAVNISGLQFRRGDLDQIVAAALEEAGLESQHLELELTESILIQDGDRSLEMVGLFKQMGVKMSIDDFGTGYSSLSYLQRLPVEKLKIDRSFITAIMDSTSDATIARSIISLAHALGKSVIAEGVENEKQLAFLWQYGCDEIQGYYFSRPLPPAAFKNFVENWVPLRAEAINI